MKSEFAMCAITLIALPIVIICVLLTTALAIVAAAAVIIATLAAFAGVIIYMPITAVKELISTFSRPRKSEQLDKAIAEWVKANSVPCT